MKLTCWLGLTSLTTQMSKGANCFSKAAFHTLVLAKKNSQTDWKISGFCDLWDFKRVKVLASASLCELRGHPCDSWSSGQLSGTDGLWMPRVIPVNDVLSLIGHESVWKKDSKYSLYWYLSLLWLILFPYFADSVILTLEKGLNKII